jgi:hypothetical protein
LPDIFANLAFEYSVPIFRTEHYMILALVQRM